MKAEIKVIHVMVKKDRNGNNYTEYVCVVTIEGKEFIQHFRNFPK